MGLLKIPVRELVPGLGHVLLRRWSKAAAYFVAVAILALVGLWMRGNVFIYAGDALDRLGFFADIGTGAVKSVPWRAGANENTTIEFTTDVLVEGQPLPAGKYGFFIAYDPNESTLIFSRNSTSWGSFFYDPQEDVLKVKVKPVPLDKEVEWLRYEFIDQKENSATIALEWEKLSIPFKVDVDYVKTQLESFRRELRSDKAFTWNAWVQAAQFCAQRNIDLDEGLTWA